MARIDPRGMVFGSSPTPRTCISTMDILNAYRNGVHKQGAAPTSIRDINGHMTVENLVAVDQHFTSYSLETSMPTAQECLNDANRTCEYLAR